METTQAGTEGEREFDRDFRGKRITVMGLGRFGGGVGVARWLLARGACVTVTDTQPADKLASSVAELLRDRDWSTQARWRAGVRHDGMDARSELTGETGILPQGTHGGLGDLRLRLGEHVEEDFRRADLVVVNPAVPPRSPFLKVAEDAGVPVTTEINLFLERCPARCIGVTGTVGKSTTVAMIAHILSSALGEGAVWLGGNIGRSLLDDLPGMRPDHWVVLELSSFQLFRTPAIGWSPEIAVITNIAPNHLDWHESFEHYAESKLNLVRFQRPGRDSMVIADDPDLRRLLDRQESKRGEVHRYGERDGTPYVVKEGAGSESRTTVCDLKLQVPGRHNRVNAAAAIAVAQIVGISATDAARALSTFDGLPNRLKRVGEVDGVAYYDDSKSTTPEAALTAMAAFEQPLVMILGGYDKGADLGELCRTAASRARFVACVGKTGAGICEQIQASGGQARYYERFEDAVRASREAAQPGDAVLLSPGCASWGMFTDYRERGQRFSDLVRSWLK